MQQQELQCVAGSCMAVASVVVLLCVVVCVLLCVVVCVLLCVARRRSVLQNVLPSE